MKDEGLGLRVEGGVTSTVSDGQGYYSTSTNSLSDSLIQRVKRCFRVNQAVQAIVLAH